MKKNLNILVTSGGTISRIDDVRHIGNFSRGKTGAMISEELMKRGHNVSYVYGQNAKVPFKSTLELNPAGDLEKEISRLRKDHAEYNKYKSNLDEHPIETFEEYYNKVEYLIKHGNIDVVVLASAVGDYSAQKTEGKISSDKEELNITLEKNPKVISLIKMWNPDVYLVGFKLLADVSDRELLDVATRNAEKTNSDMTVANKFPELKTYILFDGENIPVQRENLPQTLSSFIEYGVFKK